MYHVEGSEGERLSRVEPLLVPNPSTLRHLGFQCASPGFRDSPAEPTNSFQGILDLLKVEGVGPCGGRALTVRKYVPVFVLVSVHSC